MRYRPVYIACTFEEIFTKEGKFVRATPKRYQVLSGLLGRCGHKHLTEAAAKPCLERMKKEWSRRRSDQMKAAWSRRREAEAAKRVPLPFLSNESLPTW
jgi:hypothetical protein